jgi:hypothetical protein
VPSPSPAGPGGGWNQPAPGYGPPRGPSYQQGPAWGAAPPPEPRQRSLPALATVAPQVIASLAISVGVVVLFLADFLIALGQPTGTPGNERMAQFLAPADLVVAAVMVVAVALVALVAPPDEGPATPALAATNVRAVAGFVAAALAVAAFLRAIVVLTIAHQRAVLKLGSMIEALAALVVAAAAAYWALKPKLQK